MSNPTNRNITTIMNTKATAELNSQVQQELNALDEKSVAFLRGQECEEEELSEVDILSVGEDEGDLTEGEGED